ncbi:MAG: hypothetical protein MZV65_15980 [Chromatiales bacterium]|nr:hypothetical protein [Chromatiales bacterium]
MPYEHVMQRSAPSSTPLRRRLPPPRARRHPGQVAPSRSSPSAPCAPAPARARPAAPSSRSCMRHAARRSSPSATPCPTATWSPRSVQRFATVADLKKHKCTIEEMEEYEPHVARGNVIYAGVDYEAILREAEKEADVILWDGGNNDFSFYKPDLVHHRRRPAPRPATSSRTTPARSTCAWPTSSSSTRSTPPTATDIQTVRENIREVNPEARSSSTRARPITVDKPELIKGKRVLVVEDGPTLTHGEMKYRRRHRGRRASSAPPSWSIPRPFAVGKLAETFENYPNIGVLLPAMGYGGPAGQGPRDDHQHDRLRRRRHRHADRPAPHRQDQEADRRRSATTCRRSEAPT